MKANFLFFPGMIFHEFSHMIACYLTGVKVKKVKFFGLNEAYVIHENPDALRSIIITLAPFILGNWIAFYFFTSSFNQLGNSNPLGFVLLWLGFSLAHYSFPSFQDAKNTFNSFKDFYTFRLVKGNLLLRLIVLISIPFVFIPLFIVLGLMLLFNYFYFLRLLWIAFIFLFSFNQSSALTLMNSFIYSFFLITKIFI